MRVASPDHRAVAKPSSRGARVRKECLPDASADRSRLDEEEVQFAGIGVMRRREEVETEQGGLGDGDECRSRRECLRIDGELRAPPFEPVERVAPMCFGTEREVAEQPCFISPRPPSRYPRAYARGTWELKPKLQL